METLYYDIFYNELTTFKSDKTEIDNYSNGFLPIYENKLSCLEVYYKLKSSNQKLLILYDYIEIEIFGFDFIEEKILKKHNLKKENVCIERISFGEEFYNKLFKIAQKNYILPIDKRIKNELNDIFNLKVINNEQ